MLYVYIAFILCYLPLLCILIVIHVRGIHRIVKILRFLSATLIFMNSSLNPLLYCWKDKWCWWRLQDFVAVAVKDNSSFHRFADGKNRIAFIVSRL